MGRATRSIAIAIAGIAAACGSGGAAGSGAGTPAEAGYGPIHLLSHEPADGAVQVPANAAITLVFDEPMVLDCFGDEDTWLRKAGTTQNLAGSFALAGGGRRVVFTPAVPLELETDYEFQVSGLTCDVTGRLLETDHAFSFRTLDTTPPLLLGLDVANNSTGRSRTAPFTLTFSEAVAPASVGPTSIWLADVFGARYAASRTVSGAIVTLDPFADLPGDRQFTLVVNTAVRDRAGNALAATSTTRFRTISDADAPRVLATWPAMNRTGVSPLVQPTFSFSESMDPGTVETASLLFQDEFGSLVAFAVVASDDQRTLRVRPTVPLQQNREYTIAFLLGDAAATDVSGNQLQATSALVFTTGTDADAPTVVGMTPGDGETRVSVNATLVATFDGALDADWVGTETVVLAANGAELPAIVTMDGAAVVRVVPIEMLPTAAPCTLLLRGGHEGIRDQAGNVLAADREITFTTSDDADLPRAMLQPPDGASGVPTGAHVSIVFDAPVDPATVTSATVQVQDDQETPIAGALALRAGDRVAVFTPAAPLQPSTYYRTRVLGGGTGVRKQSGNWFAADQTARFRTGFGGDLTPPIVLATVNETDEARIAAMVLPPSGFTVDVTVADPGDQSLDMGSVEVRFEGPGTAPDAGLLFAGATVGYTTFRTAVPASQPLAAGEWTLTVRATDLSGNAGTSTALPFTVAAPTTDLLPFERTQLVWVRTDLDRTGQSGLDFDEDLVRLGLAAAGDRAGTNAAMRAVVLNGILAQANRLFGRGARGEPTGPGSVPLRFTARRPIGIGCSEIALGGLDPEGSRSRAYGAASTGVLGRAYFDYRNGQMTERNTSSAPGLGVFPAEMWLYQTSIHLQVWPAYQTVFAQRFRPLCPDMGGTPAGEHPLDAVVLAPGFVFGSGTAEQRARYLAVFEAADDWATAIGIILAHEVGHSVGLVAPGPTPRGLFGDASLHDSFAGAAEVMAPAVGYEAMTTLDYAFRDVDLAYLRQRLLLR